MIEDKIYKAAIIGCGRMGSEFDDDKLEAQTYGIRSHAGGYTDNPNTELIAVSDVSEEKLNKCGGRWNVSNLYQDYKEMLESKSIRFSGWSDNGKRVEIMEIENHPFYVATQYHPEFISRPGTPEKVFKAFVEASIKNNKKN